MGSNYNDIDADDMDEMFSALKIKGTKHHKNKTKDSCGGKHRRSSLTNSKNIVTDTASKIMTVEQQPSLDKTSEHHTIDISTKKKLERRHSSSQSSQEIDIDEELVNLVKEMTLVHKNGVSYVLIL